MGGKFYKWKAWLRIVGLDIRSVLKSFIKQSNLHSKIIDPSRFSAWLLLLEKEKGEGSV